MTSGFTHFRDLMEEIVADLGGSSRAREAVGEHFTACLRFYMKSQRDEGHYGYPMWYEASDEQMRAGADHAHQNWRLTSKEEPSAKAPYLDGTIVVYQTEAYLVTAHGFHIPVAKVRPDSKYDSRAQKMVETYSVSLWDVAETLTNNRYAGAKTNANAKSQASAYKSLRRIVEAAFKVSLENVAETVA